MKTKEVVEDWSGSQSAFRSAFAFRNRLLEGEIDASAASERLDTDETGAIAAYPIDQSLPGSIEDLPAEAAETIRTAAHEAAAGETKTAANRVREAFSIPYEMEQPRRIEIEGSNGNERSGTDTSTGWTACHRNDPEAPGSPMVNESFPDQYTIFVWSAQSVSLDAFNRRYAFLSPH